MRSGKLLNEIVDVVQAAFPDSGDMRLVVDDAEIGARLTNYLVGGVTYRQALHSLISNYADPQDQLMKLLTAARERNPGNPELGAVMDKISDLEHRFDALRLGNTFGEVERIVLKGVTFEDIGVWIEKSPK